ncbi:MAG: hypothetical protein ACPG5P_06550, partial [Saprospiraceae bacterium]
MTKRNSYHTQYLRGWFSSILIIFCVSFLYASPQTISLKEGDIVINKKKSIKVLEDTNDRDYSINS